MLPDEMKHGKTEEKTKKKLYNINMLHFMIRLKLLNNNEMLPKFTNFKIYIINLNLKITDVYVFPRTKENVAGLTFMLTWFEVCRM